MIEENEYVDQYVSFHTHTDGSVLDGFSTIDDIVNEVVRLKQPAVAISDHGNVFNGYNLYVKAREKGIKPIIAIEAYVAPSTITHTDHEAAFFSDGSSDDVSGRGAYTHVLLIAENNIGLKNLYKLSYLSYKDGFYRKPRMSMELFRQYHEGLIATTGCPSGEIQTKLRLGMYDSALEHAREMQSIFGKDNYFMELMDHNMGIDLERKVTAGLLSISKELNIPLLATNDSHYTTKEDANAHEHLLAIATRSKMSVPTSVAEGEGGKTRFAFDGSGYYLRSYAEMIEIFPEDRFPGAVSNSILIADRCNITIEPDESLRPRIPLPEGYTEAEWLSKEAYEGLARRLPDKANDQEYLDRMAKELGVINGKNFSGYFLVTSDFVRWARNNGVPVGFGRGSAAGSLLAFALDITDPDPIRHGLLFERFLNPERDSPPDIDMDFNDLERELVIQYVKDTYGDDHVAQVVTFGKILAKNGVKDTVRILDEPYSLGDELTKAMPAAVFGKTMPLNDIYTPGAPRYEEADDFRAKVTERGAEHVIEIARQLEGRIRSTGVHAAALVISSKPVVDYIPMMVRQNDGAKITQWDYPTAEALGLIKMDFLGLRNLGIVRDAIVNVEKTKGIKLDVQEIIQGVMDDPKTYELLQSGNTLGVFQLDGGGLRNLLKLLKPTHFGDISAVLSLYRPGPMGVNAHTDYALRKNGLQEVDYIHPELTEILTPLLKESYGLVIYQEQVQLIAQQVAGYSLGQADLLRRAMGKKKRYIIDAEYIPFSEGARKNGYSDEAIKDLWDILVPFADYAFNKSHTVAYGLLSYVTAFLKANYPSEYMSALLSSVSDDVDKTAMYLEDCRQNGIKVSQPNVSLSNVDYAPLSDTEISFGLRAIRGVGATSSEQIVESRLNENGKSVPFKDFNDFITRIPKSLVNKRILEGLTYGGALDSLGVSRRAIIHQLPELLKRYQKAQKSKASTQTSLFDLDDMIDYKVLPMEEYPKMEKLKLERHALGLYISAHPIDGLNIANMASARIVGLLDGTVKPLEGWPTARDTPVRIAGIVTSFAVKRNKKGEPFAIVKMEDRSGSIECAIFPKTYAKVGEFLKLDGVYQFVGFSNKRDEEINFIVDNVRPLEFSDSGNLSVRLKLTEQQWVNGKKSLEAALRRHLVPLGEPGDDVIVSIKTVAGEVTEERIDLSVRRSPALLQEVQELFGSLCIGRWLRAKKVEATDEAAGAEKA